MDVKDLLWTKPSDMALQLYLRPIHPEFFKIFARRPIRGQGYEGELWVTGLSHVLTLRRHKPGGKEADRCLTEVIGPDGNDLPDRGRVESIPLVGDDQARFPLRNGFDYQIQFHAETLDEDVFAATYEDLRKQAGHEGLACEYRIDGLDRTQWPLAITVPTHAKGAFVLYAFHVFPEHRTVLKTQSLIEMPDD